MKTRTVTDQFDVRRIGEIERLIDQTILAFCHRTGGGPGIRPAYEAFALDMGALWRIVMIDAREAGVSASEVRRAMLRRGADGRPLPSGSTIGGYKSFDELSRGLRQYAEFQRDDDVQAMRKIRATNRASGALHGGSKLDADLTREHAAYRARKPYSREYSTRALAAHLATKLRRPVGTVRNRLKALQLK